MQLRRTRIPRRADLWPRTWRRRPVALAIMLLIGLLIAWQRARAPGGTDHERYHNRTFTCISAVDGDTIDVDIADTDHSSTRVRLWGVDTPELARDGAAAMHFGPQAAAFTRSHVEGKPVRLVLSTGRSRDKYRRLLAYVYLDSEVMLNEEIIAQGYGYAERRFGHPWRERFVQLEQRAEKRRIGLWQDVKGEQMPAWRQRLDCWREDVADAAD